jgi:DNA repair exonuclease SbcCD nuclease subunit
VSKLLAIGDVHLGTRQGRLPEQLFAAGIDASSLKPSGALDIAVDLAIQERVSAVLFAGDVVESTNHRFEAIRYLEDAVQRLNQKGIPVIGVAGNHDVDALPRLARRIDGFDLLGQDGKWESRLVTENDEPVVEVVGWSFPARQVRISPVADLLRHPLPPRVPGIPRIGLLHADLNASGGVYAPVRRQELVDAGLSAWLLGHIHKPSLADSQQESIKMPIGYLGSLVGLDPSEIGIRGPWLIRVTEQGQVEPEHIPLAPIRWEQINVQIEDSGDPEDLGDQLLDAAEKHARDIQSSGSPPLVLAVRIHVLGSTYHYRAIEKWITQRNWSDAVRVAGDSVVFVDKVTSALTPAISLRELSIGDDPPAILARKLLALDEGGSAAQELLLKAREDLRPLANDSRWAPLSETRYAHDPLSDDSLVEYLKDAGMTVLHKLLEDRTVSFPKDEEIER